MIIRQLKELIRKETLILLRDKQTILLLFLMPVVLIFFVSLALKNVYTDKVTGQKVLVIVENQGQSSKALKLEKRIVSSKIIERVVRLRGLSNDELLEQGKVQAVILIPPGFEEGNNPVQIQFDPVLDAGYRIALRSMISALTMEVVMDMDDLDKVVANFIVEKTRQNRELPSPLQHTVPAYAIFAMFFIAIPMSIGFLKEKKDGTLQRLFTYPVSTNLIALGKFIPYYLINIVQFILMMLVGVYVMPQIVGIPFHLGAHPWHLLPIILIVAAAATGFGVLVAALAHSPEQSSTLAATGAVLMGVIGGIMMPTVLLPQVMKTLAMISPMYWAHQACLDVFLRDAEFSSVLPKLIVLTLFAGICFYIAGRRIKWM